MTPEPTWVDLGLPSGLLWRSANLGAVVPEAAGFYYSWGNTEGHPAGDGYNFSQDVYDTTPGGNLETNIPLENDPAFIALGAGCRMPTSEEHKELNDNCDSVWTTLNGVNGRLFTSRLNGNQIFLPAAGYYDQANRTGFGSLGFYWSSTRISATGAYRFNFNSSGVSAQGQNPRHDGFNIRAVKEA